jgi:hypothetical protein
MLLIEKEASINESMKTKQHKHHNSICSQAHILDTIESLSNYQNDYQMAALRSTRFGTGI